MGKLLLGLMMTVGIVAMANQVVMAKVDGSMPVLCVPVEVIDCEAGDKCYTGTAESVNLPQFIKVNFKEKTLSAMDDPARTAPITHMEQNNGKIVLHGGQNGRAWTAVISEETGKMSATISEEQTGFIVFGKCAVL